jgi:hypothetical protein
MATFEIRLFKPRNNRWPIVLTAETLEGVEDELVLHGYYRKVEVRDSAGEIIISRDAKGVWTGIGSVEANEAQTEFGPFRIRSGA